MLRYKSEFTFFIFSPTSFLLINCVLFHLLLTLNYSVADPSGAPLLSPLDQTNQ